MKKAILDHARRYWRRRCRCPRTPKKPPLTYTVLLAGGPESNEIRIWLTPDGRTYVIDSIYPLEVGGTVCEHPAGNPNELICQAPQVAAFEFNADGGDDRARVACRARPRLDARRARPRHPRRRLRATTSCSAATAATS